MKTYGAENMKNIETLGYACVSIRQIKILLNYAKKRSKEFYGKVENKHNICLLKIEVLNGYDNKEGKQISFNNCLYEIEKELKGGI
jgi:hypothetical protein